MKHIIVGIAVVMTVAPFAPVRAQGFGGQPQRPPTAYPDPYSYRFVAPTPEDAYQRGLINRWELERLEGPLPAGLQGPSPNGAKGDNSR